MRGVVCIALLAFAGGVAHAEEDRAAKPPAAKPPTAKPPAAKPPAEPAPRRPDVSWARIFRGPFTSSRLFAMPTADVVGAFQISLSGDASLLNESNVISSSSVVAVGFGDIAQLEYRNSSALSTLEETPIALPTLGVQLKIPLRERRYLPGFAVALRFGFPRTESTDGGRISHEERVTDLYAVGKLPLWGVFERVTLHGGLRVSQADIESTGDPGLANVKRVLWLPAGGWEWRVADATALVGEIALVPQFAPGDTGRASSIGSGVFGRAGVRWRVLPSFVLDASVGYRVEVARLGPATTNMVNALVDWDIRLGGELFVPWGAVLCRGVGVFCE